MSRVLMESLVTLAAPFGGPALDAGSTALLDPEDEWVKQHVASGYLRVVGEEEGVEPTAPAPAGEDVPSLKWVRERLADHATALGVTVPEKATRQEILDLITARSAVTAETPPG